MAVVCAAVFADTEASASTSWAIQPTPNLLIANGSLVADVCSSVSTCMAVGSYSNSSGATVTLAERWNGTSWTIQATPNPPGSTDSFLSGVSCTSASACTAVGGYANSSDTQLTLAERWNGTSWAIQATPNTTGATGTNLRGVSCTSATACAAVGFYSKRSPTEFTLAERWNGTSWAIQSTPNPAGATFSFLSGVSCTSASACTAVGRREGSTLAERWNGTSWAIQTTPNPTGSNVNVLYGLSCTSASACTAVGEHLNSTDSFVTLAERWNGTSWTIQATPNPTGATGSVLVLSGVSCPSATACTAVGEYSNSSNTTVTLAERWNGASWAIQATPNRTGPTATNLLGVSCTSASACTAVGQGKGVTLAELWNGTSWAIQATPNPTGTLGSFLNAVSCTSATACTAVGEDSNTSTGRTLAERWNGTSWAIQATPNPIGAFESFLNAVSCTSANACTAVGDYFNSSTNLPLAEHWNGTSWAIQSTPNPAGALGGALNGVSCTSTTACIAVGYYDSSSDAQLPLAERWNGTSWAIQSTPNPTGSSGTNLLGVSCSSASACVAVGVSSNSSGTQLTLAERWNGTSWAIQATPNPTGAFGSVLYGVSCTSASACMAVGSYSNSSGTELTLAERWNGTSWVIQVTPNPTGSNGSLLTGVSCTSAGACTAVGDTPPPGSDTGLTLAERWNGTSWAIQTTPSPTGSNGSRLAGTSCTSASACTAVGFYVSGSGTGLTLAERES